ncbi:hypothetical protein BGZ58_002212 [Dissophora ornata]|nr:hypothetical protein BGZ58_002212 [Dissophora ornata]
MAHYTLDYPASRGFAEDTEATAPCGGYSTVANRTEFPLSNGFLEIYSEHVNANIKINVVYGNNPAAADFTSAAATPASSVTLSHPGKACFPLDLSSFQGAANNTNATIQIVYNGGDSALYQCADVVLVSSAAGFNQTLCVNDGSSTSTSSSTATATGTSNAGSALSAKGAATAAAAVFMAAIMAF